MQNIYFKIGQPNTGKSYNFKESKLNEKQPFKSYVEEGKKKIEYNIIPVSGGIGNEYKGLQNTDLALSFDPVSSSIRFGEFLQVLMKAILEPHKPHVVFLDDFHNQDISSLLSEYTPLFKSQQKVKLTGYKDFIEKQSLKLEITKIENFDTVEKFISAWNQFINDLKEEVKEKLTITAIPITNRISGSDLQLIFPANFYLFGAANFNEKTLNIFADWNDRAELEIIDPIEVQEKAFHVEKDDEGNITELTFDEKKLIDDEESFIKCCITMNEKLKDILHGEYIFDYEKYCFGIWKLIDENDKIISGKNNQVKIMKFFFSMIKNSLIYNNKNSHINTIGWKLVLAMKNDLWFKKNVLSMLNFEPMKDYNIDDIESDIKSVNIFKLLHSLNIYDN
jgi:hypothetical protein